MKPLFLLAGLAATGWSAQLFAQKQPNIIFIMTDQQRGDAIGCAGNEKIITPNIDRLAADGYYFRHAYTAAPSSTPAARVS